MATQRQGRAALGPLRFRGGWGSVDGYPNGSDGGWRRKPSQVTSAVVATSSPPAWGISREDYAFYNDVPLEEVTIPFLWNRLAPKLGYLSVHDHRQVQLALALAFRAHEGQIRKSGEPFVTHPVEVTRILAELQLDADTLTAGLLHDTVEDTDELTFEEIENRFGVAVRRIVEGETRISKAQDNGNNPVGGDPKEALDFQHFFVSMTQDVRIILVKLADRLHNMRTIGSLDLNKQRKKAREALYVFAPLAGNLGLVSVKEELEELSIKYLDPDRAVELSSQRDRIINEQKSAVQAAQNFLLEHLNQDDFLSNQVSAISVFLSWKPLYGLYKKLRAARSEDWVNNQELQQISQLQVVLNVHDECSVGPVGLCYYVLGIVHKLWTPIPQTMKDYIASPKAGWRKGLQTTLWPVGSRLVTPIEVQIQTVDMYQEDFKEISSRLNLWLRDEKDDDLGRMNGFNSLHSSYDEDDVVNGFSLALPVNGRSSNASPSQVQEVLQTSSTVIKEGSIAKCKTWLKSLKTWQAEIGTKMSARDFVECVTEDFLVQSVYVLTPAGEVVQLPKGATVLDFAYHIHTDVGNRAMAAKVDGRFVSPNYQLSNAQVVEIFRLDGEPDEAFLSMLRSRLSIVQTKSAKKKLKMFLKNYERQLKTNGSVENVSAAQDAAKHSTLWLMLECQDKPGVLAQVSSIIAKHGLNVTKFWGYPSRKDKDVYVMHYNLGHPNQTVGDLCSAVMVLPNVSDWAVGCTLPRCDGRKQGWRN